MLYFALSWKPAQGNGNLGASRSAPRCVLEVAVIQSKDLEQEAVFYVQPSKVILRPNGWRDGRACRAQN